MKDFENLPEIIFDLLAQKKYSELSGQEKSQVDKFMSEEEFDNYRMVVHDFQNLDARIPIEEIKSKPVKKSTLKKLLNYPIPFYQVAAAFLLLTLATIAIPNLKNNPDVETIVEQSETERTVGKSLAKDDYPEELVFNF